MHSIETVITPTLLSLYPLEGRTVVVIDVLRATTSICTALENGAAAVIPIADREEAKEMRDRGFLVASEREGLRLSFANFGNSPSEFTRERVFDEEIVYCTTNGTKTITQANAGESLFIGAFCNLTALANHLIEEMRHDLVLLCSGWMGRFNLEDTLFAGALAERLCESEVYKTECDSTKMAMDLWSIAKDDLTGYAEKAAHRKRLEGFGLRESFEDCMRIDTCSAVPQYCAGRILPTPLAKG